LGELGVTYVLHLWLVGKSMGDFLFAVTELFSLALRFRRYKQIFVEIGVFQRRSESL